MAAGAEAHRKHRTFLQEGEGAELACKRRGVAAREEMRERWGRRADWMARVTGHNLVQKGSFLLE